MFKALFAVCTTACLALSADLAAAQLVAQDAYSANARLRGCQNSNDEVANLSDAMDFGMCLGVVATLMNLSRDGVLQYPYNFCAPTEATIGQAKRVIVRYIEMIPERMHQDIFGLALEALQHAWPCGKAEQ